MPDMNVYTHGAVVLNGTQIKCIESLSVDQKMEAFMNRSGGSPYVTFASGKQRVPLLSFDTYDIRAVLQVMGLSALAVSGSTLCDFYFPKRLHGSAIDPASVHRKWTLYHGLIIPRKFTVNDRDEVKVSVDVLACYDGTHAPLITADNAALPAGSQIASNKFTLGPWKLTNTLYDIKSTEIDCGIKEFTDNKNGEPYDRFACMDTQELKASMKTSDLTITTVTGLDGANIVTTIFFRKLQENSSARVPDATAEHISITFAKAFVYPTTTASGKDGATQGVDAIAVWNGSVDIGAVSLVATIA